MNELLRGTEQYRNRNSNGVVIYGPLYRPRDIEEIPFAHRPRWEPPEEHLLRLSTMIRETNMLGKMDSLTNPKPSPGRAAEPLTLFDPNGGVHELAEVRSDHDPWWVQIGG